MMVVTIFLELRPQRKLVMIRCHGIIASRIFSEEKNYCWAPRGPTSAIFTTIDLDRLNFEGGIFTPDPPICQTLPEAQRTHAIESVTGVTLLVANLATRWPSWSL